MQYTPTTTHSDLGKCMQSMQSALTGLQCGEEQNGDAPPWKSMQRKYAMCADTGARTHLHKLAGTRLGDGVLHTRYSSSNSATGAGRPLRCMHKPNSMRSRRQILTRLKARCNFHNLCRTASWFRRGFVSLRAAHTPWF